MERTEDVSQLAAVCTTADVFFNPTREDDYHTVNLEAEACGTPVVTYDVGGCAETVARSDSKAVLDYAAVRTFIFEKGMFKGTPMW